MIDRNRSMTIIEILQNTDKIIKVGILNSVIKV